MGRSFHIFGLNKGFAVQREGSSAQIFPTQREAILAARKMIKEEKVGQIAIHGKDGGIRRFETYGLRRIQVPSKRSPLAKRMKLAIDKMSLERVRSSSPV